MRIECQIQLGDDVTCPQDELEDTRVATKMMVKQIQEEQKEERRQERAQQMMLDYVRAIGVALVAPALISLLGIFLMRGKLAAILPLYHCKTSLERCV